MLGKNSDMICTKNSINQEVVLGPVSRTAFSAPVFHLLQLSATESLTIQIEDLVIQSTVSIRSSCQMILKERQFFGTGELLFFFKGYKVRVRVTL